MTLDNLIEKYKAMRVDIVTGGIDSWEDLGFDVKPDEWNSIEEFMESEELDEYDQALLSIIDEIIDDLDNFDFG